MTTSPAPFVAVHFVQRSSRRVIVRARADYAELVDFLATGSTLHELQEEDVKDSASTLLAVSKQLEDGDFRQF